ncbi:MAG: hypothetical protein EOO52_15890 [Gammaproteobacteria bacterium]|nr:MAG: hypothetical protein EOO52_15890 [Gammaproteobacteria bacterium]
MKLIDRYISAVAQQLPVSRRDDITRELRANILDRLESFEDETGHPATSEDESAILRELGHPQRVAAGFLPPQTLVNSNWFPVFKQSLTYGLLIVFVVQMIGFGVTSLNSGGLHISGFISHFVHAALIMFAVVTGVFYTLSNLKATANLSPYCKWTPEQLPPVQHPWQRIKLEENLNEFVSNLFFLVIVCYGYWMSENVFAKFSISPNPNLSYWVLPLSLWAIFSVGFSLWKFRYSYWTQSKLLLATVQNLLGCTIAIGLWLEPELFLNHSLRASVAQFINQIAHWTLICSFLMFLFWAVRNLYWFSLMRKMEEN